MPDLGCVSVPRISPMACTSKAAQSLEQTQGPARESLPASCSILFGQMWVSQRVQILVWVPCENERVWGPRIFIQKDPGWYFWCLLHALVICRSTCVLIFRCLFILQFVYILCIQRLSRRMECLTFELLFLFPCGTHVLSVYSPVHACAEARG